MNEKIRIIDRRTLEVLTSFGDGGRQPGQFYGVHNLATEATAISTRPRPTTAPGCSGSCSKASGR